MIGTVQQPDSQSLVQQVLWRALELLNLSGEFMDDSYQPIPTVWERFLQHDSVRLIARFLTQQLQASPSSIDALAQSVAREYGEFLCNACEAVSEKQSLPISHQARQAVSEAAWNLPNTSTVRIPLEWIPEPERGEVGLYLSYLKSQIIESARRNLAKYLETIPLEGQSVSRLAEKLSKSTCVAVHHDMNLESAEIDWLGRQIQDLDIESLGLPRGFLLGSNSGYEHLGFTGCVVRIQEQACRKCPACLLVSAVYNYLVLARQTFGEYLWTQNELSSYVLLGKQLPDYVGYLEIRKPLYLADHQWGDWRRSSCISIKVLPCLSRRSLSSVYAKKPLPPRLFCLATFLIFRGETITWLSSDSCHAFGTLSADLRLERGKLLRLMEAWNSSAPEKWRYAFLSNFSRDLKKARCMLGFTF